MVAALGARADLLSPSMVPVVTAKMAIPLGWAFLACCAAVRLSRPERRPTKWLAAGTLWVVAIALFWTLAWSLTPAWLSTVAAESAANKAAMLAAGTPSATSVPAVESLRIDAQALPDGAPTAPLGWDTVWGQTWMACLLSIPALTLPGMALGVRALRQAAPTWPMSTGAWVDAAAGGFAAAFYALHCTEDHPLFFLLWYSLAVLLTATLGAFAGRRGLRW